MLQTIIKIPDIDCDLDLVSNTPGEIKAIKKTGQLFDVTPHFGPYTSHYLVSKNHEFCGILEYELVGDAIVITGMWVNSNYLLDFIATVYANLALNFREVRIRDLGIDTNVIIRDGVIDDKINPVLTSSIRILDIDSLPDGSVRTYLYNHK
jgi:hypothetical protein